MTILDVEFTLEDSIILASKIERHYTLIYVCPCVLEQTNADI